MKLNVAGCMTGTSMDGLDVSVVQIEGDSLELKVEPLEHKSLEFGSLSNALRDISLSKTIEIHEYVKVRDDFSHLHCELISSLSSEVDLISVHGQTLYHNPPQSLQMINSSIIAHTHSVPVVSDLRAADLACGGQGAPITPLSDWILFKGIEKRAIVNLGGFCNTTLLPEKSGGIDEVSGLDVCPCNHLLDNVCRHLLKKPFDENGVYSASGKINEDLMNKLNELMDAFRSSKRSLGTGDELFEEILKYSQSINGADVLRTLCAVIARQVNLVSVNCEIIILAGGGALNPTLVEEIARSCGKTVCKSDDYKIPVQYRESVAMAILGYLCKQRIPITLSQVTHTQKGNPVAGVWVYP